MKNISKFALSIISSMFLLYTLTILDFLSFGNKLIGSKCHGENIENYNMSLFTFATIAAQTLFGTFSSLKGGICGGVIVESQPDIEKLMNQCESKTKSVGECLTNLYACLFLSTILFAIVSLICSFFGAGKIFEYIPKTALFGVMTSIGVELILSGKNEIYRSGEYYYHLHYSMIIAVFLSLLALFVDEFYPGYIFFIPCYSILIVVGFYIVVTCFDYSMDDLRNLELIPTTSDSQISFSALTEHLSYDHIKPDVILGCLKNIISLVGLNMVHITVNVPSFSSIMNIKADINDEFRSQGLANLVTAFIGYPSYFVCSTSVFFNRSGGTTKLHSILGGVALTPLIFIGPKVRQYLPSLLLSFIPIYIGFCFIYSNIICYLSRLSLMDLFVVLVTAVTGVYFSSSIGLIIGIILNVFIITLYSLRKPKYSILPSSGIEKNCQVIKIDFIGQPLTKSLLIERLSGCTGDIVIDLNDCRYLDCESNHILKEFVINYNGNVRISGVPSNMYVTEFKKYLL